jgi:hypothetical protein
MTPATNRTRILNPLERFSEIVFGLIMVLSFTGALSVAEVGREDIRIMLLADYHACIDAQDRASALWRDPHAWTRQSILNSARMGNFSSDRSIRDYCERVWKSQPASVAA